MKSYCKFKSVLIFLGDLEEKTMSASDKELEEQLAEAGNKLLQPPSSLDELITLLDVSLFLIFLFASV